MGFLAPLLVGTAAVPAVTTTIMGATVASGIGAAATGGFLGFGGAVTAGGLLSGASNVLSFFGGQQQSAANQQLFAYQAAVARNNQIIATRAAEDARLRGEATASRQALLTRQLIGRQRVTQAALGQEVGTGSALDITADTAATGRLEELTIRANAEREVIGFLTQAGGFGSEAEIARLKENQARTAGFIGGLGTILTTASALSRRFRERSLRVPTITGGFN